MSELLRSKSAASEVIGVLLILGLITTTVSLVLVTGLPSINDYQQRAKLQNVEQAFTVLDSRFSTSALGESPSQVVQLDTSGGSVSLLNDTYGHLSVIYKKSGTEKMIYNDTIGTIRYELGDEEVGYEGGGVWRKYADGGTIMVSPPEFHYNGETLTMPIVKLNGSSSKASGLVTLQATSQNRPTVLYQNTSNDPDFINPVYGSTIIVKIKSRYYKAWADYFRQRTDFHGVVTHDNESEALAYLNSRPAPVEAFGIPLDVIGLNTTNQTPVSSFKFELANADSSLHLDMIATKATGETLRIEIKKEGGLGTRGGTTFLEYTNGTKSETWESNVAIMLVGGVATADLMSPTDAFYNSNDWSWTWGGETPPYGGSYRQTPGDDGPVPFNVVIEHYYRIMGPTFTWEYNPHAGFEQPKGFTTEGSLTYHEYDTMPPRITFLHVVEHRVDVKTV